MRELILGKTGIRIPQNGFGCLPVQRISFEDAVDLLRAAYEGGMLFYDTARAYSDSEAKLGEAFYDIRNRVVIATKTHADSPEVFWKDLDASLRALQTDVIDIYQFHCAPQCYRPNDGTGMYECMMEAKRQGLIRHIGITAHKIQVALEAADSGLYETIQFPFSYLASEKELALVEKCRAKDIGFIAMKGLAGGLITRSDAAMAFISQFDNVLPVWGIQHQSELEEWLSYMRETPQMDDRMRAYIEREQKELSGEFCRGCGYCMPCPAGIEINNCARMSLLLRRTPPARWLTPQWQEKMMKIEGCLQCRKCTTKCPYGLDTPALLQKNLADYKTFL